MMACYAYWAEMEIYFVDANTDTNMTINTIFDCDFSWCEPFWYNSCV